MSNRTGNLKPICNGTSPEMTFLDVIGIAGWVIALLALVLNLVTLGFIT